MSHFTTLKTKLSNRSILNRLLDERGWVSEYVSLYKNPYTYSNEVVEDATVVKDQNGKVRLVLDKDGSVIVDPWYMGDAYEKLCQDYSAEVLEQTALSEGAFISNKYVDNKTGELVIELEFL